MSIIFRFDDIGPDQVHFGIAPAQEALHSLVVLYRPKRHPLHIEWILRTRKKISPALKAELEFFHDIWLYGPPLFWDVRETAQDETFAEQLQSLLDRPLEFYLQRMLFITLSLHTGRTDFDMSQDMNLDTLAELLP